MELSRTQNNKATNTHIGSLKARLAKLRTELLTPAGGPGGGGEGFDVARAGDGRVALIGECHTDLAVVGQRLASAPGRVCRNCVAAHASVI